MVRVTGFEPTTFGSASQRSIQLSYTRKFLTGVILACLVAKSQFFREMLASGKTKG
jgi:hypothetical protein